VQKQTQSDTKREGAMINIRNILKVLLVALFVCAYSGDVRCQGLINQGLLPSITQEQACPDGQIWHSPDNSCRDANGEVKGYSGGKTGAEISAEAQAAAQASGNSQLDASFCSTNYGIFKDLVRTGRTIFNRLRDLIYVVAGFGIIAVAVGGFFGNLNWKWLGAIIISLVVMATAGEIIVLITGCEDFDNDLITNTLSEPTDTLDASYGVEEGGSKTVREYNEYYVGQEPAPEGKAPAE